MRLYRLALSLLLIFSVTLLYSQSEFKDGFIIKEEKKYVYGYIQFSDTPDKTCFFKETPAGTAVVYTPDEIEGYGVINENPFLKRSILSAGDEVQTLFIEAIEDGSIILFQISDRLFAEKSGTLFELNNDPRAANYFRTILYSFTSGNAKFAERSRKLTFTVTAIKAFVRAYNVSITGQPVYTGKVAKTSETRETGFTISYEGFVGLDRAKASLSNTHTEQLDKSKFTDRTLLHAGAQAIIKPNASRYFSYSAGIWLNDQRCYLVTRASNDQTTYRTSFKSLRIPVLIRVQSGNPEGHLWFAKTGIVVPILSSGKLTAETIDDRMNEVFISNSEISKNVKDVVQLHVAAGRFFRLSERFSVFTELYLSHGKRNIELDKGPSSNADLSITTFGLNAGIKLH